MRVRAIWSKSGLWKAYLVMGAAAIAVYFLSGAPSFQLVLYNGIAVVAFGAILLGIRRNRPALKRPWYLLAAGILLWAIGDVIWSCYDLVLHRAAPWPSVADYAYIVGPVLMALGLTVMLRRRGVGRDVESFLDALIIAIGVGTLSWTFLMAPYANAAGVSVWTKMIAVAYPLTDILLLAVVVRMLITPGRHATCHRLLAVAVTCTLVGDAIYSFQQLNGTYYTGNLVDITWLAFYFLIGAAALHPSMASVAEGQEQRSKKPTLRRLAVLAAAASLAPLTLIIQTVRDGAIDVPVMAGASIVMFLLVVVRMGRLVRQVASAAEQLGVQSDELRTSLGEQESLETQLRYQASHDPLTDLPNRTLFHDRVGQALKRMSRAGLAVGLLFIDVDDFKTINDTLGHEAGDRVLIDLANRLRRLLREADSPARLGGDEFAVLLDMINDAGDAAIVAERILQAMSEPFVLGGREVDVHVSIGIASSADPVITEHELIREADTAMYAAKSRGKNGYVAFEPALQKAPPGSVTMQGQLVLAIKRGEFRALYQPIVELESGRLMGTEALIRWQHPRDGLISPAAFLPIAEDSGVIVDIDRWILREACSESVRWRRTGLERRLQMNVNLSAASLQRQDLVKAISSTLSSTGADPRDIVFEITESVLVRDIETAVRRLNELKALGVRIAIDDFGTGYSSLNYLRRFPIDILKIDKSFVDGVARGPEDASFAAAIITLAEQLHLSTVAEGVETEAQRLALVALGAQDAQGFLFSRPVSADQMLDLVTKSEGDDAAPADRAREPVSV
jgi:diguanylate cyclase